jgi:hypothetical protein
MGRQKLLPGSSLTTIVSIFIPSHKKDGIAAKVKNKDSGNTEVINLVIRR